MNPFADSPLRVIDTHTGGEPTRVVVGGLPDLGGGPVAAQAQRFREEFDGLRRAVANEPRGHEAMVGALLLESVRPECECGVVFFNNVGTLPMCIHGTIGLAVALARLGRIGPGVHRIETPAGVVAAEWHGGGKVSVTNVPSWRHAEGVEVEVPGWGTVRGDIGWGGNWFFLVDGEGPPVEAGRIGELEAFARAVKQALVEKGLTGADGMEVDHVELFGPPLDGEPADSRNFVLCPGNAYDRSPCGTGTSAKLACLVAAGKLRPGEIWRQAGILGSVFEGRVEELGGGKVLPTITGSAWVNGESEYYFDPADPFGCGLPEARRRT